MTTEMEVLGREILRENTGMKAEGESQSGKGPTTQISKFELFGPCSGNFHFD
jgi:hypothetical protein